MSGKKDYFTCELDSDLDVTLHLDEEGDMFISVERQSKVRTESAALITKKDAKEIARILACYADS